MQRIAAALLVATTGCSLAMRDAPPQLSPQVFPDCTESRALPVVDLFGAAGTAYTGFLLYALAHLFDNAGEHRSTDGADIAAAVIGLGGTAAYIASAVSGFGTASRCRQAKQTWLMTMAPRGPVFITPSAPSIGAERGFCRQAPDTPCDHGLVCASGHCVALPPGPPLAPPPPAAPPPQ